MCTGSVFRLLADLVSTEILTIHTTGLEEDL